MWHVVWRQFTSKLVVYQVLIRQTSLWLLPLPCATWHDWPAAASCTAFCSLICALCHDYKRPAKIWTWAGLWLGGRLTDDKKKLTAVSSGQQAHLQLLPLALQLLLSVLQLLRQQLHGSFPRACSLLKQPDLQVLSIGQGSGLLQLSLCGLQCILQLVIMGLLVLESSLQPAWLSASLLRFCLQQANADSAAQADPHLHMRLDDVASGFSFVRLYVG